MKRFHFIALILFLSMGGLNFQNLMAHSSNEGQERGSVGPDKGITEYDEHEGFKLSKEALKNFDLKYLKLSGQSPWAVPKSALVHTGVETNLFRKRNGFFKRIDFETVNSLSVNPLTNNSANSLSPKNLSVDSLSNNSTANNLTVNTLGTELILHSKDLKEGDEVVLVGNGFLRIAELAVTGGMADGDQH